MSRQVSIILSRSCRWPDTWAAIRRLRHHPVRPFIFNADDGQVGMLKQRSEESSFSPRLFSSHGEGQTTPAADASCNRASCCGRL